MKTHLDENTCYEIVVIGAGFAGIITAQKLCEEGYNVLLVEAGDGILNNKSSSYNECYKLHTGVHYIANPKTAVQCLNDSIQFARQFPNYILDYANPSAPWRRGRHYLMSNSLFDESRVRKTCELLQKTYTESVKKNPLNKVFGEPTNFIRYLDSSDYPHVANSIPQSNSSDNKKINAHVILGIETAESQIDLDQFRGFMIRELGNYENLTFTSHHTVKHVGYSPNSLDYCLTIYDSLEKKLKKIKTKAIVNCTWQNVEKIDRDLGYYQPDHRLIRVKVSLKVYLPHSLKNINTCIFFSGPHCSVTNLGDGTAIITYEPATNVGYYNAGSDVAQVDQELADITNQKLVPHEGKGKILAEGILKGAAHYIPELKNAVVTEVRVGHVKIFLKPTEKYTLDEEESPIHRRVEDGVEQKGLCYISHSGMKMTYTQKNAIKTKEIIDRNLTIRSSLIKLIEAVQDYIEKDLDLEFYKPFIIEIILYHSFRLYMLSNINLTMDNVDQLVEKKVVKKVGNVIRSQIEKKRAITNFFKLKDNINIKGKDKLILSKLILKN